MGRKKKYLTVEEAAAAKKKQDVDRKCKYLPIRVGAIAVVTRCKTVMEETGLSTDTELAEFLLQS